MEVVMVFVIVFFIVWPVAAFLGRDKNVREEATKANEEANRRTHLYKEHSDILISDINADANEVEHFYNDKFSIVLSEQNQKIVITTDNVYSYTYDDLMNVEVIIDENIISSPSLGGAIVGGLLFGGAGAIIGSSNKSHEKTIRKIVLRINMDNIKVPIHDLIFLSLNNALPLEILEVKTALENANNWYGRLVTIIEKRKVNKSNPNSPSVADEILKLKKLLDDGIINNSEFEASKIKLLDGYNVWPVGTGQIIADQNVNDIKIEIENKIPETAEVDNIGISEKIAKESEITEEPNSTSIIKKTIVDQPTKSGETMKIQCPSCHHEGTVPANKVPSTGVTVSCPKCQTKFKITPPDFP